MQATGIAKLNQKKEIKMKNLFKKKTGKLQTALGTGMALFGAYGWKTYLFAGSGFAWPISLTLIVGGVLISGVKK